MKHNFEISLKFLLNTEILQFMINNTKTTKIDLQCSVLCFILILKKKKCQNFQNLKLNLPLFLFLTKMTSQGVIRVLWWCHMNLNRKKQNNWPSTITYRRRELISISKESYWSPFWLNSYILICVHPGKWDGKHFSKELS